MSFEYKSIFKMSFLLQNFCQRYNIEKSLTVTFENNVVGGKFPKFTRFSNGKFAANDTTEKS